MSRQILPIRSALPIQDVKIHTYFLRGGSNLQDDFSVTLHRLFKKFIISANTIGAVITDRYILTPLRLFVMTMPIQKAVTSGNGNIEFYRESTRSNCK